MDRIKTACNTGLTARWLTLTDKSSRISQRDSQAVTVTSYFKEKQMTDIQAYFDKNLYRLDENAIYHLNEQDNGPINNVIKNLDEHCYGVHIYDDKEEIEYLIFYIDNKFKLSGLALYISIELDFVQRTLFTIEFCKLVNDKFPHANIVDTFNTIQNQARSLFEKMGFFTIGNELENIVGNRNAEILVSGGKGIMKFPTMDKKNLYRWFFNEKKNFIKTNESNEVKKIYLLLDSTNNLIKIGQSYYPTTREKTLQGISPEWDLITTWIAPISVEKELHKKFQNKRTRGEWFDLSFSDLKEIKQYMSKYKNSL